jgi:hypothetical protein
MDLGLVFRRISNVLDAASTPYMLTGSFASSFYEALRSTQDIDVVIAPTVEQLRQLLDCLQRDEFYADADAAFSAYREQSMFNALDHETGWRIDFIFCKSRAFSKEKFRRRKAITFQGVQLFVATAEDVILAKLECAKVGESQRQFEDAAIVLKKQWGSLDRAYLDRWIVNLAIEAEFKNALQVAGLQ